VALRLGYKQSEIGLIPGDWQILSLGSLGCFTKGQGIRKAEANSGAFPCVRYGEIYTHHNDIIRSFNSWISDDVAKTSKRLRAGDLLFAGSGETKEEIGKCVAFLNDCEAYAGGDIVILSPISGVSAFLAYLFNSPIITRQKASKGQGDAVVHISARALQSVKAPIPPEAEQSAIAAALSDVDGLLAKLDQIIAKKRDLKQAAMQQLLTGQTRLPGFGGEWQRKSFAEALYRLNAKEHQVQASAYQDVGAFPVVDQGQQSVIGYSDRADKVLRCPDGGVIVFGDHTCIAKFVDFDFVIGADGTQIVGAKTGECLRFYAYQLERRGIPSTGYNRHFKFLKERTFSSPPLAEQTAIATVLSDIDAELTALAARRDKTRALKQGMMQELLTGRIRLV